MGGAVLGTAGCPARPWPLSPLATSNNPPVLTPALSGPVSPQLFGLGQEEQNGALHTWPRLHAKAYSFEDAVLGSVTGEKGDKDRLNSSF